MVWQCANLTVPVDYRDGSNNKTTQIGVTWAHPKDVDGIQKGLFSNPGGPGGS